MTAEQFELLAEEAAPYVVGSRTESTGLLAWFLENVWRLEPEDVDDSICDGGGDKGIDALVVDEDLKEITIFQAKRRTSAAATQGDADLKNLVGSAAYFESPQTVDRLLDSRPNEELRRLLTRLKIRDRVADGAHATRLVFVSNGPLDGAGRDYVSAMAGRSPTLEVWDRTELGAIALRTRRPDIRDDTVRLTASSDVIVSDLDAETRMALCLVPANQLVTIPGIDDLTLFSRNVRLSLKRTRINRELASTVAEPAEHVRFPAYHNGLTVLTRGIHVDGHEVTLDGVGVVNGCQSLVVLYEHRASLTDELRVLVKAVQVDPSSDIADDITYRANNQNPVDIRDQRSTDAIQRDLQSQVREHYGQELGYAIRAGEDTGAPATLDNKTAAQLLMAVYTKEPWNAVRKVRLFDEDYHRIFNREVSGHRLRLLHSLSTRLDAQRARLRPELQSSFASVRLTIAYLVARVLEESELGALLLSSPEEWFPARATEVHEALDDLIGEVIDSVNFYVESERAEWAERGEVFDAKVLFKSATGVRALENVVLREARRQAKRDAAFLFGVEPSRP